MINELASDGEPLLEAASWHHSRPETVVDALAAADRAAPQLAELARAVLPRMPRMPLASQNLRSSNIDHYSAPLRLDLAVSCPWVTFDGPGHRNALVIDIDHSAAKARWLALPADVRPILVRDPWSGRAHAIVLLASPVCVGPNALSAPGKLASFAGRLMAAALDGRLLPHRSLAKWPWGERSEVIGQLIRRGPAAVDRLIYDATVGAGLCWHTDDGAGPLELRAIVAALDGDWRSAAAPPEQKRGRARGQPDVRGRNCALFDVARWWAYDNDVRDAGLILDRAVEANLTLPVPLPHSEVASMSRSIAKFMTTRFGREREGSTGSSRGRDQHLTGGLSPREARSLSARRTNQQRRGNTSDAVQAAACRLRGIGTRLTQRALASEAGVSARTVRRWWRQLGEGWATPCPSEPISGQTVAHQVLPSIRAGGRNPDRSREVTRLPSIAEEVTASRHRNSSIAAEVRYYRRRIEALSRRGFRARRSTFVRWPKVMHDAVVAEWKLAEAALESARRRANRHKQRRKQQRFGPALLGWPGFAIRPFETVGGRKEIARLSRDWERYRAAIKALPAIKAQRRQRLRSLARSNAPALPDLALDRMSSDWTAMNSDPSRPINGANLDRYEALALGNRRRSWQRAKDEAGRAAKPAVAKARLRPRRPP